MTPPLELAAAIRIGLMPSRSAVTFWRLPKSAFEPASVPGQGDAQPAEQRAEEGEGRPGPGQAQAEDRVHARIARHEGQPDHEADRQQRRPDGRPSGRTSGRSARGSCPSKSAAEHAAGEDGRAGQRRTFRSAIASSGCRHRGRPAGSARPPGEARASAA